MNEINNEKLRILFCCPETMGDIYICTGVIDGLKKKFPNSTIYFATKPENANILDGNPQIKRVIDHHDSMLNYRNYESFAMSKGIFDFVFCPFIITQRIPHWIHSGKGEWLGRCYADMCNVEYGTPFIQEDDSIQELLPKEKYITVQSQTTQEPKNYSHMQEVISKIKNFKFVQIGGHKDAPLKIDVDLRGKTTPQQLVHVFKRASFHIGLDSFPMHVIGNTDTPAIILFGGTYAKQGVAPHYTNIHPIEPEDRGICVTSCHLIECEAKKRGLEKCIDNIPVETVLSKIRELIGEENVEQPEPIKISSYMIIKDGIKYGFPYEKCIMAALRVSDEVVVIDGGSIDGTYEDLLRINAELVEQDDAGNITSPLKIERHEWDMNNPTLFGDEKTYARQQCTGTHLIQLDADEIIQEPYPGAIRVLISMAIQKQLELNLIFGNGESPRMTLI
jgi:ADP-heptose:LPS heptosyltransferase